MLDTDHNDSIVQRGIDEALACQDMLERAPVSPSLLAQAVAWLDTTIRALADRDVARGRRATPAARHSVP